MLIIILKKEKVPLQSTNEELDTLKVSYYNYLIIVTFIYPISDVNIEGGKIRMVYQGNLLSKTLVIGTILLLVVTVSPINGSNVTLIERDDCPISITVHEAWELLTDTSNGIQIPIDVRYNYEWNEGFIDTPWPECPVWYTKDLFQEPNGLQAFLDTYDGGEVIIYCEGGYRSWIVCLILCDFGFSGTVYDMIGGITAWIDAGYPIRNNTSPAVPTITGPSKGGADKKLVYNFTTEDAEEDGVWFIVDWDDNTTEELGPFAADEEISVNHTYASIMTYTIKARVRDFYDNQSGVTEHVVEIPRKRASNLNLLCWFFERFPLLEVFLRAMNLLR